MLRRNPLFLKSLLITSGIVALTATTWIIFTDDHTESPPLNTAPTASPTTPESVPAKPHTDPSWTSEWRDFLDRRVDAESIDSEGNDSDRAPDPPPQPTEPPPATLDDLVDAEPEQWGETVRGVRQRLDTEEPALALTLDACGGDYDRELLDYLRSESIKATLFVAGYWASRHSETLRSLADDPLFEIANHGLEHRPCSVTGASALEIEGTDSVAAAHREIVDNAQALENITGQRPHYYRSGTAHYDEICTTIATRSGHTTVGFDTVGDHGATYSADQVHRALLKVEPGSIIVVHMNRPQGATAQGLKKAVPELREQGFKFVHLDEYELR